MEPNNNNSTTTDPPPSSPSFAANKKLEETLTNPRKIHHFRKFLESELNHENLLFWLDVETLKNGNVHQSDHDRQQPNRSTSNERRNTLEKEPSSTQGESGSIGQKYKQL